jgi:hypothetical protein
MGLQRMRRGCWVLPAAEVTASMLARGFASGLYLA